MAKPTDKLPDGPGNRSGGTLCRACGGEGGKWATVNQVVRGESKPVETYTPCKTCRGSGQV